MPGQSEKQYVVFIGCLTADLTKEPQMKYPPPNQIELLAKPTSTAQISKYAAGSCQNPQIQIPLDMGENGMRTHFVAAVTHTSLYK